MKNMKFLLVTLLCVGLVYSDGPATDVTNASAGAQINDAKPKRGCDTSVCHSSTPGAKYTHPSFKNESIQPRQITSELLEQKIAQNPNLKVVNVLGKMLYDDCSIAGSINCPLRYLEATAKSWNDKEQEIVVYCACRECDASLKAYRLLTSMGFTNLWEYEHGIREWYQERRATEGPCKEHYLSDKNCK